MDFKAPVALATLLALGGIFSSLDAQGPSESTDRIGGWPVEFLQSPIELLEDVGTVHDPVSTDEADAQAYHDQGLALLHLFAYHDAVRSFNAALRIDPELAATHLALSLAYERLGAPGEAREALEEARRLAPGASEAEQSRIALRVKAMAVRDGDGDVEAYGRALHDAIARFPEDAELRMTLAASSGDVEGRISRLHEVLEVAPDHTGAIHLLAHQYEQLGDFESAAAWAGRLGEVSRSVPHALQMVGYYLPRLSRPEEALPWFESADRLERSLIEESGLPAAQFPNFQANLRLLAFTYWQLGRSADAKRVLREAPGLVGDPAGVTRLTLIDMEILDGRVDEAIRLARRLLVEAEEGAGPISAPAVHGTLLFALVRAGELEQARAGFDVLGVPEGGADGGHPRVQRALGAYLLRAGEASEGAELLLDLADSAAARAAGPNWFPPLLELELLSGAAAAAGQPELAERLGGLLAELNPAFTGARRAASAVRSRSTTL
jgi:tetratricopeptide (TPR) repeat protein